MKSEGNEQNKEEGLATMLVWGLSENELTSLAVQHRVDDCLDIQGCEDTDEVEVRGDANCLNHFLEEAKASYFGRRIVRARMKPADIQPND